MGRRAQYMGRHGVQPVRHLTRDGRVQLRIGRIGRGEPGAVLDLRGDRWILPSARMAQRRGGARDNQGADAVGGGDRRRPLSGSRRHPVPNRQGRGPCSGCAEGSHARLLRSARHLFGVAEGADLREAVRVVCDRRGCDGQQAARRRPHWHRPRVHGQARGERYGDERPGQRRDRARGTRRRRQSSSASASS